VRGPHDDDPMLKDRGVRRSAEGISNYSLTVLSRFHDIAVIRPEQFCSTKSEGILSEIVDLTPLLL